MRGNPRTGWVYVDAVTDALDNCRAAVVATIQTLR
jgi:hypothetical protein